MPFVPSSDPDDDDWDLAGEAVRFLLSPIMFPVTLGYGIYDYMEGTDYLDRGETIRNTGIWGAAALGSWAYHAYMFPGQFSFLSGSAALRTAGYLSAAALIPTAFVGISIAGTAAQFDVAAHHGAGTRGSLGSAAPSYYYQSEGSSSDILPGLGEHPIWPWNW